MDWLGFFVLCMFILTGGCANVRVTDPRRTATEQFLLSQAAVEAVAPLTFEGLRGRKVHVDSTYFASDEKEFVLAEIRAKLLRSGVQLLHDPNEAQIILELRSGGVGVDRYESLLGLPALSAGPVSALATEGTLATILTPELAITKEIKQISFASVAYVAYRRDTGEVVASSDLSIGKAYRDDWWLLGMGPRTIGTVPTIDHHLD
jgi:hypothetical protein